MRRWTRAILVAVVIAAALPGCQSQSKENARKLLDDYLENSMSVRRTAASKIEILDELDNQAQSLKGQLPQNFYDRFHRLIATTRLSYTPNPDEHSRQEIGAYVQSITGSPPPQGTSDFEASMQSLTGKPMKFDMNLTLSSAFAFSEEVLRLNMLIDGETDREKERQRYLDRRRAKKK